MLVHAGPAANGCEYVRSTRSSTGQMCLTRHQTTVDPDFADTLPGTGPASARAPKLRCAPSRLASRPGGQGARRSRASGLPPGTPGSRPDGGSRRNAAHRRTRQRDSRRRPTRTLSKHHRAHPALAPYHHSAGPGGLAPTGLCTATRNACSAIQNRAERRFRSGGYPLVRGGRRARDNRLCAAARHPGRRGSRAYRRSGLRP